MCYTSEDFDDGMTDKDMYNGIKEKITDANGRTAYQIVEGIYNSVITIDITKWYSISNFDLFNRVVKYVVENVGKTFSANTIVKFLKSEGRSLSVESVYNCLEWLEKAFVIYRCQRYNLQGKSILKTQEKFRKWT